MIDVTQEDVKTAQANLIRKRIEVNTAAAGVRTLEAEAVQLELGIDALNLQLQLQQVSGG